VAVWQSHEAESQREVALSQKLTAEKRGLLARSRELGAQSQGGYASELWLLFRISSFRYDFVFTNLIRLLAI